LFRPDIIAHRKQFGHWEADLVLFRQKYGPANVTTMIERTSRFLVALKNAEKRTKPIMAQIAPGTDALVPACLPIDHL
jgi:IS30 family transposase